MLPAITNHFDRAANDFLTDNTDVEKDPFSYPDSIDFISIVPFFFNSYRGQNKM